MALPKVVQDGLRSAAITVVMKYHAGLNVKMDRCRVRPSDGGHLFPWVRADIVGEGSSSFCGDNGQVPRLVKDIARISQPGHINQQHSVSYVNPRQKCLLVKLDQLSRNSNFGEECPYSGEIEHLESLRMESLGTARKRN